MIGTRLKAALDPVARRFGFYTAYPLSKDEYVGSVDDDPTGTRNWLLNRDYERPPTFTGVELTAAKKHPETGAIHDYSLRRVDPDDETRQWHVHLFYNDGETEVYSHKELRPDFRPVDGEDVSEMVGRLQIHYRPDHSTDEYQRGVADETVRELVE